MTFLNYLEILNDGHYTGLCVIISTFKNQFTISQLST